MAEVIARHDGFAVRDEADGQRTARAERLSTDAPHGRYPARARLLDVSGPASCGAAAPLGPH
jgi:hypothetical protein